MKVEVHSRTKFLKKAIPKNFGKVLVATLQKHLTISPKKVFSKDDSQNGYSVGYRRCI